MIILLKRKWKHWKSISKVSGAGLQSRSPALFNYLGYPRVHFKIANYRCWINQLGFVESRFGIIARSRIDPVKLFPTVISVIKHHVSRQGPTLAHPYYSCWFVPCVFFDMVEVLFINTVNTELYWSRCLSDSWCTQWYEIVCLKSMQEQRNPMGLSLFSPTKWLEWIAFGFIITCSLKNVAWFCFVFTGFSSMSYLCLWVVGPFTFHAHRRKAARDIHQKEATWQQPTRHFEPTKLRLLKQLNFPDPPSTHCVECKNSRIRIMGWSTNSY